MIYFKDHTSASILRYKKWDLWYLKHSISDPRSVIKLESWVVRPLTQLFFVTKGVSYVLSFYSQSGDYRWLLGGFPPPKSNPSFKSARIAKSFWTVNCLAQKGSPLTASLKTQMRASIVGVFSQLCTFLLSAKYSEIEVKILSEIQSYDMYYSELLSSRFMPWNKKA